jgi:hypothetical protein
LLGFVFAKQNTEDLFPAAFAQSTNPLPADAILN